ncbi:hypothetical protein Tco_0712509 [Tanacetum coccineum]
MLILESSNVSFEIISFHSQVVKFVFHFLDFSSRAILIGQEPFQFGPGDPVGLFYPNRLGVCIPPGQGIIGLGCTSRQMSLCLSSGQMLRGKYPDSVVLDSSGSSKGIDWWCGVVDLTDDEDPTDKDRGYWMGLIQTGFLVSLVGEIFLGKERNSRIVGESGFFS